MHQGSFQKERADFDQLNPPKNKKKKKKKKPKKKHTKNKKKKHNQKKTKKKRPNPAIHWRGRETEKGKKLRSILGWVGGSSFFEWGDEKN